MNIDFHFNEFLPADAIVLKRVTIGDDNSWFVVELIEKENPKYGLIKGKEDYMIKKGKKSDCSVHESGRPAVGISIAETR